jgi:hypothetical protein
MPKKPPQTEIAISSSTLEDVRLFQRRAADRATALGFADLAVARAEMARAQARADLDKEEKDLNAVLQRDGAKHGIDKGPDKWDVDIEAGVFRKRQ